MNAKQLTKLDESSRLLSLFADENGPFARVSHVFPGDTATACERS